MGRGKTYRSELRACALGHHGYVTARDIEHLGIPDGVLARLVVRGRLLPVADGVYRLDDAPTTRWNAFAEAVLQVGHGAVLSHDSVLALHHLGGHEPDRLRVSVPHPVTRAATGRPPRHIEILHHAVGPQDLTTYHGIPSTTVTRALLDCRPLLALGLLVQAAEDAVERGLLLRRERHAVLDEIEAERNRRPFGADVTSDRRSIARKS